MHWALIIIILAASNNNNRGVGRRFGKGGLYRSIGKGSMISVYKSEPSYVTIRKYRGAPAPRAPMVPMPMNKYLT